MNNIQFLKSKIKFLNHIFKINCFFLNLKNINFNVNIKNQIELFENLKIDILNFLLIMEYYNLSLSYKDFNKIYLIEYNSKEVLPTNNKNTKNLVKCVNKIISHIKNFDLYDNFCLLKTLNRFNRFKYELFKYKENDIFNITKYIKSEYNYIEGKINELQKHKVLKNNLIHEKINESDVLKKNSKKIIDDQFWSELENDFKFYPIQTKKIFIILDKIISIIFTLLKNDRNMFNKIEKNINILELKKNFDTYYFIRTLNYLLQLLKLFHSKKYNDLSNLKHKILKYAMIDGTRLDKFAPDIIKYLLDGFYTVLIENK